MKSTASYFQADDGGSIPLTRSSLFNGLSHTDFLHSDNYTAAHSDFCPQSVRVERRFSLAPAPMVRDRKRRQCVRNRRLPLMPDWLCGRNASASERVV
jgi:hypothetical protein